MYSVNIRHPVFLNNLIFIQKNGPNEYVLKENIKEEKSIDYGIKLLHKKLMLFTLLMPHLLPFF